MTPKELIITKDERSKILALIMMKDLDRAKFPIGTDIGLAATAVAASFFIKHGKDEDETFKLYEQFLDALAHVVKTGPKVVRK